jgi:hypothetical protein
VGGWLAGYIIHSGGGGCEYGHGFLRLAGGWGCVNCRWAVSQPVHTTSAQLTRNACGVPSALNLRRLCLWLLFFRSLRNVRCCCLRCRVHEYRRKFTRHGWGCSMVAMLLTNIHTCLCGSETSLYLWVAPSPCALSTKTFPTAGDTGCKRIALFSLF